MQQGGRLLTDYCSWRFGAADIKIGLFNLITTSSGLPSTWQAVGQCRFDEWLARHSHGEVSTDLVAYLFQLRILLFRQIQPHSASPVFNAMIKRLAPFKIQI